MNRIHFLLPALLAALLFVSSGCTKITDEEDKRGKEQRLFDLYVASRYPDVVPQTDGLYFIDVEAGSGISPDDDDWMLVNHVCYTLPEEYIYESYIEAVARDHLFYNSGAIYGPFKLQNGVRNEGLTRGLSMMKKGGKAILFFTSDLGYGSEGKGSVGAYQSLKYEIELLEVIKDMDAYEQAKIDTFLNTLPQYDTIQDTGTGAVLYYIKDTETEGEYVVEDSLISVAYRGYLADGRVFDEHTSDEPYEFILGEASFIVGWDLILPRLREGESVRMAIPYPLAYGEAGKYVTNTSLRGIPPYETLFFDMEILSVETVGSGSK